MKLHVNVLAKELMEKLDDIGSFVISLPDSPETDLVAAIYTQAFLDFSYYYKMAERYKELAEVATNATARCKFQEKMLESQLHASSAVNFLMKDEFGLFFEPKTVVNTFKECFFKDVHSEN